METPNTSEFCETRGSEFCLKIRDLFHIYHTKKGDSIEALVNINLSVAKSEFITIVGPSGCGKSTLLKILGGLLSPSKGEIFLMGSHLRGPRREVGIVFQDPVLLPWKTVLQNLMLPIEVFNLNKNDYAERAHALIKLVGLEGFENKYPFELSGGMQQRNAITRALIHDPAVLLMDEPFGALDAMTREIMNLEILRIWTESKKTVLFVTHSIPEAVFLADRVIVLSSRPGRVVRDFKVTLGRPRNLDMMGTDRFGSMVKEIRGIFGLKSLDFKGGMD
jgi:NitT/TauT family transport system ATP-binding protein